MPAEQPQSRGPAADAVRAAPGGAFAVGPALEARLGDGRMPGQIGGVVGDDKAVPRRLDGERVGERALAPARVVAVGFAVGGDVDELIAPAVGDERGGEAPDQRRRREEQPREADVARDGPVVEEEVERAPRRRVQAIGLRRIDRARRHVEPVAAVARGLRLVRREDGEREPLVEERLHRRHRHRRLGQPHGVGAPPEAALEVGQAPADLRAPVALVAQGQDGVVVRLRDGVAEAARGQRARVGDEDAAVGLGRVRLRATTRASGRS